MSLARLPSPISDALFGIAPKPRPSLGEIVLTIHSREVSDEGLDLIRAFLRLEQVAFRHVGGERVYPHEAETARNAFEAAEIAWARMVFPGSRNSSVSESAGDMVSAADEGDA